MVKAFEDASGVKIPMEMAERRPGDVAESYATCDLAEKELGFKCKYTIFDMCKYLDNKRYGRQGVISCNRNMSKFNLFLNYSLSGKDTWTWQSKNPKGFVE